MNLIVQALRREAIHRSEERRCAGRGRGGFEKKAPARIDGGFIIASYRGRLVARFEESPNAFHPLNPFHPPIPKKNAKEPKFGQYIQKSAARNDIAVTVAKRVHQTDDDHE